jgi:flagellar hook assembly protein FlgD
VPLGNPVAVAAGEASTAWQSHGYANGLHTIAAHSCSSLGAWSCAVGATTVSVNVTNTTPVLTAPTPNRVASGTLKMAATADGTGGVAFLVNGVRKAFDATAPYTASVAVDKLADGTYAATAESCDTAGTTCSSVASDPVPFKVKNLHPTITSVTASPFSPNGDGVRDSVTIGYSLPDTETATWRITGPTGTVKDAVSLGTLPKGARTLVWNGKSTAGTVVPDGTYSIVLTTAATVSGRKLVGRATHNVVVDRTAPRITAVTGDGTTIYSSGGGTPASLTSKVTLDEPGAITLTIRNSTGGLVRILTAAGIAGKTSIAWNGKNTAGALVTSGIYTWRLKVADAAGNARNGGPYTVNVLHLATRTTHLQLNGNQSYGVFTSDTSCTGYNPGESTFPNGTWLINQCPQSSTSPPAAEADYQFTVPAAYSYQSATIVASAYTDYAGTEMYGAIDNSGGGAITGYTIAATTPTSHNLGTYSGAGFVDGSRHLRVAVGIDNRNTSLSDIDINWVNVAVTYTVKL